MKLRGERNSNITDNFEGYIHLTWSTFNKTTLAMDLEIDKDPPIMDDDKSHLLCQCKVLTSCYTKITVLDELLPRMLKVKAELEILVADLKKILFKCKGETKPFFVILLQTPRLFYKRKNKTLQENLQGLKKVNASMANLKSQIMILKENPPREPLFLLDATTATTIPLPPNSTITPEESDTITGSTVLAETTGSTALAEFTGLWQNLLLVVIGGIMVLSAILISLACLVRYCIQRVRRNAEAQAIIRSIARKNAHRIRK